jgi:hypothetical protein
MKELTKQTQQTQAQLGGEAQQKNFKEVKDMWREKFKLIASQWTFKRLSSNFKHWANEDYSGGEITVVYAPSHRIEKLMDEIESVHPSLLRLIKEVYVCYWVGNEFRGSGPDRGYIKGDKEFLSKLIKEARFEWIDKGWGDWCGTLKYDKEFLESLKEVNQ